MKYVSLTFLLEPNATGENNQISVESTQYKHIQCTFQAIDSPACQWEVLRAW